MGVINTTPDSFSDGGSLYAGDKLRLESVLARARDMVAGGAQILDIGGESTRPGAVGVSLQQELDRVVPCVEAIASQLQVTISVDTSSPEVMRAAAAAGAGMINDVRALGREGALDAAAELQLPVCLMHMRGEPGTMQQAPEYADAVAEVMAFLLERATACQAAGVARDLIYLDPGFGFGKTLAHNLQLLRELPRLVALGYPVLVGLSRKSMIGSLLDREVGERMPASIALALLAVQGGAAIVRTHDVRETADALAMLRAVSDAGNTGV
jgi:dihydropteroate synthase